MPNIKIKQVNTHLFDCFFDDEWDKWIRWDSRNQAVKGSNIRVTKDHIFKITSAINQHGKK